MKVFNDTGIMEQSAYFGWQDKDQALYGLREGYKNSADNLVEWVLENPNDIKMKDTYIFPIIFSYRHSLEISMKHIYLRAKGIIPVGRHNLLKLWGCIKREIIDDMICSEEFLNQVKNYKENFIRYSLNGINLNEIQRMLQELQEANQKKEEIKDNNRQMDQNAQVWRYLMRVDDSLFFSKWHFIDYMVLKNSINYMYEVFDFIYHIIDEYLSS